MYNKSKRRLKAKISVTGIRSPINLQQIANDFKAFHKSESGTTDGIPFIKPRGFSPFEHRGSLGKNTQSLKKISIDAGEFRPETNFNLRPKGSLNIDLDKSSEKFSFTCDSQDVLDSEEKEIEAYQFGLQKFQKKCEEKSFNSGAHKTKNEKKEYKEKAKKKMQEILNKQSEIHKFQIESLKKFYEEKITKYKEIIVKLQHENEELANGSSMVKHSDLVSPLIEENLWLKHQMGRLSNKKYKS